MLVRCSLVAVDAVDAVDAVNVVVGGVDLGDGVDVHAHALVVGHNDVH